jgi:diguanylate cyclase (GGDEF)-like protein/PAS domain S-box-containing protein
MIFKQNIVKKLKKIIKSLTGDSDESLLLEGLKAAGNAVVITDITGKIQWVNAAFLKISGYESEETIGQKIGNLLKSGEHDKLFYKELWDTILSGRIWKGVITNRRKNGSFYIEEQSITPVYGDSGEIINFISIKEDITEKLRIEEALKDSDMRWQIALEAAGDGLWDWDLKRGRVFYSKQLINMFGYGEDEISDSLDEWEKRVHPEDIHKCFENMEKHFNHDTDFYQNEHRMLCKDGSYKWILDRGRVVSWRSDGRPLRVIGTNTDITERKRAEAELLQKSEEIERFFTVALDLLCIADNNGTFLRVNRSWERTLGYSMDELVGKSLLDFVHPEDIQSTRQSMEALNDQIPVLNFTNRYRTNDGSYRFIEWRSYPSGEYIYAAARDITDRIQYEYELNNLAERLTLATESAGIGIWDWDITNKALIWDQQMYVLYGMDKETTTDIYLSWRQSVHPEDRDSLKSLFVKGIKDLSGFNANFRVVWPDGTLHYLEAHALVVRDDDGKAVRITGVSRDVTENKKMEEKLFTLSTTDSLTDAYNRRYFLFMLDSEISRSVRYKSVFSLIMFDIDHFKNVNDTYGHDAGDEVLKGMIEMMQKRIRKNDVLARWGGEEFMILLSGTNIKNAVIFADKLLHGVRGMTFEKSGSVTASFGVTEYRLNETSDSVLKRVDELVYLAKNNGRDCVKSS